MRFRLNLAAGTLLILAGCGGGGSPGTHTSPFAATYGAKITGQNTQAQQVTGTVILTVNPDGSATAVVYDANGNVLANLSGTVIGAGATMTDSAGKVMFGATFLYSSTITLGSSGTVTVPVHGVFGTWSNSQISASGSWASTVPVVATPLTTAQVTSIEAGCAAEGINQIFNPLVVTGVDLCQLGTINPNEPPPGTYSYTDSQGNVYSVLITSATGTDSANKPDTSIFIAEILPSFNLNVVTSWPSASVPIASLNYFEEVPALLPGATRTRPAR